MDYLNQLVPVNAPENVSSGTATKKIDRCTRIINFLGREQISSGLTPISDFVKRIQSQVEADDANGRFNVSEIVPYGSVAEGVNTSSSDVDFFLPLSREWLTMTTDIKHVIPMTFRPRSNSTIGPKSYFKITFGGSPPLEWQALMKCSECDSPEKCPADHSNRYLCPWAVQNHYHKLVEKAVAKTARQNMDVTSENCEVKGEETLKITVRDTTKSGPAVTLHIIPDSEQTNFIDVDMTIAFEIKKTSGCWPFSDDLILHQDIVDDVDVCHLVAYGDYWRLTFPLLEKRLVKNLPSPFKVGLRAIKAMRDRDTETDYKQLLPSYRIKTAILKACRAAPQPTTSGDAFVDALREVLREDSSGPTTPYIAEDLICPQPQPSVIPAVKHLILTINMFDSMLIVHDINVNFYKFMYLFGMFARCVSLCLMVCYVINVQINSFLIAENIICGEFYKQTRNTSWINGNPRSLSLICLHSGVSNYTMELLSSWEKYHLHWKRCVNMISLCSFHQSVRYSTTPSFILALIVMFLTFISAQTLPSKHPLAESHKIMPKIKFILVHGVSVWSLKCNIDIHMISTGTESSVEPVTFLVGVVLPLFVILMQLLFHKYELVLYRTEMWFAIWVMINVLGITKGWNHAYLIAYHPHEHPVCNMYVILTAWNITVTAFLYLMEDATWGRYIHILWAISCLFYILPVYKLFLWINHLSNQISIFMYLVLRLYNPPMHSIL